MLEALAHACVPSSKPPFLLHSVRNGRGLRPTCARKPNTSETSPSKKSNLFSLRFSKVLVARSTLAVFGLGFIDAGYSGDWSRIGAISKETEEVLKAAAYLVVPLCVILVSFISDEEKTL